MWAPQATPEGPRSPAPAREDVAQDDIPPSTTRARIRITGEDEEEHEDVDHVPREEEVEPHHPGLAARSQGDLEPGDMAEEERRLAPSPGREQVSPTPEPVLDTSPKIQRNSMFPARWKNPPCRNIELKSVRTDAGRLEPVLEDEQVVVGQPGSHGPAPEVAQEFLPPSSRVRRPSQHHGCEQVDRDVHRDQGPGDQGRPGGLGASLMGKNIGLSVRQRDPSAARPARS